MLVLLCRIGGSQATLVVADAGQYPLLGTGDGKDGLDNFDNVNWLLDDYYQRDVEVFSIGKFEELKDANGDPTGVLMPVDFTAPWNPDWFTWDGNILDATEGYWAY